jgi:hypothetical protein
MADTSADQILPTPRTLYPQLMRQSCSTPFSWSDHHTTGSSVDRIETQQAPQHIRPPHITLYILTSWTDHHIAHSSVDRLPHSMLTSLSVSRTANSCRCWSDQSDPLPAHLLIRMPPCSPPETRYPHSSLISWSGQIFHYVLSRWSVHKRAWSSADHTTSQQAHHL